MPPLHFEVLATCPVTRARVSKLTMNHGETMTPTFMPVATQASMKSITNAELASLTPRISLILNNTYHLSLRPGTSILDSFEGRSHAFQGWDRNLLTDSGGFQMVSLVALSTVKEEGVEFASPFNPTEMTMLSPEKSMEIQHSIGADIMMQLDDVVSSLVTGPRVEEATERSIRWLKRCIAYHKASGREEQQNLFGIIQGGLDERLRERCLDGMLEMDSDVPGWAVGGLSGGEEKAIFWKIVRQCTTRLPPNKPRYSMGIGFGEDLLVCAALGVDLADCVFPTRTARFGVALTFDGPVSLHLKKFAADFEVLDQECTCPTCDQGEGLTKSALHGLVRRETVGASAVTLHNLVYQATLMQRAREAIMAQRFPEFLIAFFKRFFKEKENYPSWAVDALRSVNVDLISETFGPGVSAG